jgi:hypothetical protein
MAAILSCCILADIELFPLNAYSESEISYWISALPIAPRRTAMPQASRSERRHLSAIGFIKYCTVCIN